MRSAVRAGADRAGIRGTRERNACRCTGRLLCPSPAGLLTKRNSRADGTYRARELQRQIQQAAARGRQQFLRDSVTPSGSVAVEVRGHWSGALTGSFRTSILIVMSRTAEYDADQILAAAGRLIAAGGPGAATIGA